MVEMTDLLNQLQAAPGITYLLGAVAFISGSIFGFLTSRFTRTKAERDTHNQRLHENGERLVRSKDEKFSKFVAALQRTLNKRTNKQEVTLDDFIDLSSCGDLYFSELRNTADACLTGQVSENSRTQTFLPALEEAVNTSLPSYYDTLSSLAEDIGQSYSNEPKRKSYESIYVAVEKFGHLLPSRLI